MMTRGRSPTVGEKLQCQSDRFPRFWGKGLLYKKGIVFKFKDMNA